MDEERREMVGPAQAYMGDVARTGLGSLVGTLSPIPEDPAGQSGIHSTMDDLDRVMVNITAAVARLAEKLYPFMVNPDAGKPCPPPPNERDVVSSVRNRIMNHAEQLAMLDNLINQITEQIDN